MLPPVQVVRRKLQRPRIVGDLVERQELLSDLEAASRLPLTLVHAPPGYGKTTLVVSWIESREGLSAWLSPDTEDSDPRVFLSYLVAAIQSAFPDACTATLACLADGETSLPVLAGALSNDLDALPAPLVVVIDDFQRIVSPSTHALLDRLLLRPPDRLHLVLISRTLPPLSLGALRVREALSEIGMRELRLSTREAALVIERCAGRALPPEALERACQRSEGWPAGVRLVGLALRAGSADDCFDQRLSAADPQVQQYLVEELIAREDPAVRNGLLRLAIVDSFCVSLAANLLAGVLPPANRESAASVVERLIDASLWTVPVDDRPGWYRYHVLFREFLLLQLARQFSPAGAGELHRYASGWFEAHGLIEEALDHALVAGGPGLASELLVRQYARVVGRDSRHRLERCLSRLPAAVVDSDPELLLLKSWLLHHQGRHVELARVLQRAEHVLGDGCPELAQRSAERFWLWRGRLLALRSQLRYLEGQADDALACATEALQRLPGEYVEEHALAWSVLAGVRQMHGEVADARRLIHDALACRPRASAEAWLVSALCFIDWMAADLSALLWTANEYYRETPGEAQGYAFMARYFAGLVQYQRNELAVAEATLIPVLRPYPEPSPGYRAEGSMLLAEVYQALGQGDKAREIVDGLCARLQQKGDLSRLFRARACEADLALRQGRIDAARDWARSFDPGPAPACYHLSRSPHLTLARVWVADGGAEGREQAGRLLQLLESELVARHNTRYLIEVLALQALLRRAQGDAAGAAERLTRALALAKPAGFVRVFVDLGHQLVPVLRQVHGAGQSTGYVGQLLAAFKNDWLISVERQQISAELTRRELKILRLLAARLSNLEISEELCISRATVKRHTQNIYRKLQASSRREAVLRAKSLNILLDG
ncbi:LuxR C-terminal-related transcriptional regulator [Accumulibacter sp.]|uniref:LuxR C-terminal-related transcriptional regulator n=1 Tax=Accumulibacter sp. TaxID=2053492 RepID=UPI0025EBE3A3|nr:LuxR C-terminal-related transcriptional regulator [Accumulibacter sp.]MCM8596818.1 LuxR C-terminal-related transcriptional regulator [Accumulibacter sp.]MDS4050966.1 LuxR C-terminal-related transcriptional regulator [Accumulibacter sp.]